MTERKTPRNTTELPISVAIEKLSALSREQDEEHKRRMHTAETRVLASLSVKYGEKAHKILLRVPEEFREHVRIKAGGAPQNDSVPAEPADLPPGAREMPAEQVERVARLTGKART